MCNRSLLVRVARAQYVPRGFDRPGGGPLDLKYLVARSLDLPTRIARRLRGRSADYRQFLFDELTARLHEKPKRILEIGPRDGEDTRRLSSLAPDTLVLVDLPDKEERVRQWLGRIEGPVELIVGNLMYDARIAALEPFDLVWCTGVLYHNPEQLRMVRRLFDLTRPGGYLALESATARRPALRDENCVEIWHGIDKSVHRKHHVSKNITHLPSAKAIRAWMEMVGFTDVAPSRCHRKVGRALALSRAAFIGRRSNEAGVYYEHVGGNYAVGAAQ